MSIVEQTVGQWQESQWQDPVNGESIVRTFSNSEDPRVAVLGGWAEGPEVIEDAIQHLGEANLAAVGIEYAYPKVKKGRSAEDTIHAFLGIALPTALHDIRQATNGAIDKPFHLVGTSAGAAAVVNAASLTPELYGSVAAVDLPGLNGEALGKGMKLDPKEKLTPEELERKQLVARRSEFLSRFGMLYQALGLEGDDNRPRFMHGDSARISYVLSLPIAYSVGLLRSVAATHRLRVFSSDEDVIFNKDGENDTVLAAAGLSHIVEKMSGHHVMLRTPQSRERLKIATKWALAEAAA